MLLASATQVNSIRKTLGMNRGEFKKSYESNLPRYARLSTLVNDTIASKLDGALIPYLNVEARLKSLESSLEKLTRKNYNDPFNQIEDFCGNRVICYYPDDVDAIAALLRQEFDVLSEEDTQERMKPHEFGYRSRHLIITIPNTWLAGHLYRGLGGLKAEVQIRTVMMHAWAEIQHKLAYKNLDQVPDAFQRRLFRLSAKFEEADEQLEQIRKDLTLYRAQIRPAADDDLESLRGQPLNLDTLTILLDKAYPSRGKSLEGNSDLLGELAEVSLEMNDLIDAILTFAPISDRLEDADYELGQEGRWEQLGAIRTALDVANDVYYHYRLRDLEDEPLWLEPIELGRNLLRDARSSQHN